MLSKDVLQRPILPVYVWCEFYNEIMNFGAMLSSMNGHLINHVRHATVLTLI